MADYDYMDYGFDYDPEEERRRREAAMRAQAQAQAQDIENGANAGGMRSPMGFGDIVGQAFDNRINSAQNRFNEAASVFSDPQEAFRKRLGVNQQAEEPTPVKQTVTTNPVTGEQTMKVEGNVRDLSPNNPYTPTVTGPVAPTVQTEEQQRPQQQQFAQQFQQYRPVAPTPLEARGGVPANLPSQGPIAVNQPMPNIGQPPTPGPAVQVASNAPGLPIQRPAPAPTMAAAPGASLAQMGQAQAQAQDQENGISQQPAAWVQAANAAGSDLNKLFDVAAQHPESRVMIQEKMKLALKNKTKEDEANELFKSAASGNLQAWNKIQQSMRPETGKAKEEVTTGDYVRAYMYKRLGLDEMARDVQNKIIGKDTKFGQTTFGGSNWETETDSSGRIIRAKDNEGNIATESTLNQLRAAGQKFGQQAYSTTGGSVTIPAGQPDAGEEYRTVFNSTSGRFENTIITGKNAGQPYTGPAGLEKRVATNAAVALNDAYIKFQTAPTTAMAIKIMEAAALIDDGSGSEINKARATIQQRSPEIYNQVKNTLPAAGGQPNIAQNAPSGATDNSAAFSRAQGDLAAIDREIALSQQKPFGNAKQQADRMNTLNTERQAAQQRLQQAATSAQAPSAPSAPAQAQEQAPRPGGSSILQRTEQQKADIAINQNLEEKKNAVRLSMPASELNASTMLNTLNDIMTHPGLDKTIGDPLILNTPLAMIPQSDRRAFKQKYQQLAGQEFLAAYNQLRGGGSISETEGLKAEQAISALKDTGISPAEFKKNAWILQDVVKRGIDSQRALVGQQPKYAESPDREEAKEWLRNNPNHPKAAGVRKKLVGF